MTDSERGQRGRLKIFFGASAGVGKTYAMLEEARAKRAEGVDVVIGWVETHGRAETQALLEGLPSLAARTIERQGRAVREFDLDAALARRTSLFLLDDLAHTNVPGSRHEKRWQDVEELLDAGIDCFTTINVQHLESVNDLVAQATGIVVRDTVPDRIFESADDIQIVDITPQDLLDRLRDGKVHIPAADEQAIDIVFSKGNLIALRELALRRAMERVDAQMRSYKTQAGIEAVWPLKERILVCVTPSPASPRVVRAARRMASSLDAEWIVVNVEKPGKLRESEADRRQMARTLRLAEQLGAEVVTLLGHSVTEEVVAYARSRNVTKIVVGKPRGRWWRYRLFGSVVEELVRHSDDIDVYVIRGKDEEEAPVQSRAGERQRSWRPCLWSVAIVLACTGIALLLLPWLAPTNLVMIYLLGVVIVAVRFGRGPSMLASVLSVVAFDFYFVPPRWTLAIDDTEYLLTFATMLAVGILISTLAGRLRTQAQASRMRERRTASLFKISRELSRTNGLDEVVSLSQERICEVLGAEVWILRPGPAGELESSGGVTSTFPLRPEEKAVARWVFDHGTPAGRGTGTLPAARGLYFPLTASDTPVGVLGLFSDRQEGLLDPERSAFIEVLAGQTAQVIERARLVRKAQEDEVRIESERLRDVLLSSVSHDLRTPLGTITGVASLLADPSVQLTESSRHDLAQSIWEEADALNRLVGNLLNMSRLESGALALDRDWHPIDEVVGAGVTRLRRLLQGRPLTLDFPDDLPLTLMDDVLIEQVVVNLLENAVKHTPAGTQIEVRGRAEGEELIVEVADQGPGLPPGGEERIFGKFQRAAVSPAHRGVGLGLAICRGFVEAHGGWIIAEDRSGGGAVFRFALPLRDAPSPPPPEEERA